MGMSKIPLCRNGHVIHNRAFLLQEVIAEACQSNNRRKLEKILWQARKEGRFGQENNDNAPRERQSVHTAEDSLPASLALTHVVDMADATLDRPHVMCGVPDGDDDIVGEGMEVG